MLRRSGAPCGGAVACSLQQSAHCGADCSPASFSLSAWILRVPACCDLCVLSVCFVCRLLMHFGLTLYSLLELFHLFYAPFNCFPSCAFLAWKNVPLWNKPATVHLSVSLWPSVSSHLHCCYSLSLSLSLSVPYVIGRRCSKRIDRDVHQHVLARYGHSLSVGIITSPLARSQSTFCAFEMRHSNDIYCSVIINVTVTETAQ